MVSKLATITTLAAALLAAPVANAFTMGETAVATGIQGSLASSGSMRPAGTIGSVKNALGAAAATKQGQLDKVGGPIGWGGKGGGASGWAAAGSGWFSKGSGGGWTTASTSWARRSRSSRKSSSRRRRHTSSLLAAMRWAARLQSSTSHEKGASR